MIRITTTLRTRCMQARRYTWAFLGLLALFISFVGADITRTATDGSTPLALAPGAPAGSYALTDFDTVNLYNGSLNFHLPLLHIAGRGGAQMTMHLKIAQRWRVEDIEIPQPGGGSVIHKYLPQENWWEGIQPGYGPGVLQGRYGQWGQQDCPDGSQLVTATLARLTFTAPDGTEYELRDQDIGDTTGGRPRSVNCGDLPFGRGQIFVTADGTSATFQSDTNISDNNRFPPADTMFYPSGYLMFRDGTRYRIANGVVCWMRDRNGNQMIFAYDKFSRVTSVQDSLNRQVRIDYYDVLGTTYDQINFTGFGGAARRIQVHYNSLGNVLRPDYTLKTYTGRTPPGLFPELDISLSQAIYNPSHMVSAVVLPDDRQYQFRYNSYGELARVVLPTGGAFEYDWEPGIENSVSSVIGNQIYRRVVARRI